ncbi:serine/threonine-protein kinase TBK1, partial [Aplysia californica]|uniref:Serine/threonine-protein kinase TBK1 n=1 Tax=Aplysia californica TaxID=6500 RepID=A0ABM1ABB5_APLCA
MQIIQSSKSPQHWRPPGTLLFSENYTWNTADSVGRGASAVVFLGRHKVQGTVVAVKVFHDHVGYKQDDVRELELLRQLDHPNIIRLLAIETETSKQKKVLVMEYCEGASLHHMLDQPTYYYGLPESEYLLVLTHVAAGMRYLRDKNVVHRDIKPGNIMRYLSLEGFSQYKLTDFGAARNLDEDESFMSLYGTEEYLHPGIYERAVLKLPTAQSFDAKVDLWSLGVTFYHTATGQLPFQPHGGRSNRQTM